MNVDFTPEQEALLCQIAMRAGKTGAEQLIKELSLRLMEIDANFREAVREGIAAADRGEFVDEAEMDEIIEHMLHPA